MGPTYLYLVGSSRFKKDCQQRLETGVNQQYTCHCNRNFEHNKWLCWHHHWQACWSSELRAGMRKWVCCSRRCSSGNNTVKTWRNKTSHGRNICCCQPPWPWCHHAQQSPGVEEAQNTAAVAAMQRKTNEQRKLELEVENVREKGNSPASWNSKELKTMVKWFKWPGDTPLPNWKGEQLWRCEATKTHNEQDRTYLKDGEHAILYDNALEEEAAAGRGRETTMGEGGEAAAVWGSWCDVLFFMGDAAFCVEFFWTSAKGHVCMRK